MIGRLWLIAVLLFPFGLSAQQVRHDPVSGDYFVTVIDYNGQSFEIRVVPANRVNLSVSTSISGEGPVRSYSFSIQLGEGSPQALRSLRIPCPLVAGSIESLNAITAPGASVWFADQGSWPEGDLCEFIGRPLAPEDVLTIEIGSAFLPAVGHSLAVGAGAGIADPLPGDAGESANIDAFVFAHSVDGTDGGWKEITSVVPTRDPSLFADPADGLSLIQGDLTEACGTLGWISSTDVCAQLASGLAESATSVTAAAWREARSALSDFLTTVEAQHDSAGPRTVDGNAFALLATNARFVFDRLPNPPTAAAGGPYAAVEGSPVTLDGASSTDPDGATLTFAWDFGDGQAGTGSTPTHTYADDGTYQAELVVTSSTSALADTAAATVAVGNAALIITSLSGPLDPVSVGTSVTVTADFTDVGVQDTHSANVAWGDGATSAAGVSQGPGSGSIEASHAYGEAGVYTIVIDLTDDDAGSTQALHQFAVVYDASAGFVTGGGWIHSPLGAYAPDPSATGRANFGFVSRYQQGAEVPEGETQFRMRTADLTFHSDAYQWLVVAGARAQFKGTGVLNGASGYGFMLTAVDGEEPGGGGVDLFRIKIWRLDTEEVVYDNQRGDGDDAAVATGLGGGQITIHRE